MHSTVSWRPAPPGCMSGTLNDVLMFTSRNRPVTLEMSEDKDVGDRDLNSIEWQLLRDGTNGNNSRQKPSDLEFRLPFGSSQKHHMMTTAASQWDNTRNSMDGRGVVNYLGSLGPGRSNSSSCGVDGQVGGGIRNTLDGRLLSTMNREDVTDREEEFGTESPGLSSLILGQSGQSSAQLFGCGLVVQSTATKGQVLEQVHKAPHFRNLFPEQSSSFSKVLTRESLSNDVDEHIHPQKKQRLYDFADGPGPVSRAEIDPIHLNEGNQYRNTYAPRVPTLADFIDTQHSYKIPPASFSPSVSDKPAFGSNTPFQDLSLSTYQVSNSSLPLKSSTTDTSSTRSSLVDYGYSVDAKLQNAMRNVSVPRGSFLLSGGGGFKPLSLMEGSNQALVGRDFMQSGAMGQVCSIHDRPTGVESGIRAAWPAGYIFPSAGLGGASGLGISSRRGLVDLDHRQHHFRRELGADEREVHRIRPISESQIRLVIQKQLTTTDVGSLGRIILPKKEAETHLPHLPDKEGIEMCLYDYDVDRTWIMKYRFWPNNKSRMYLLENTGEFAKYHGLQQGDLLLIYRQLPARYVLRVKKVAPPLRLVTPPQSISESGAGEDLISPAAETVSSRALTSSTSSRTLTSSAAASKEVCGTDVPAFSYVEAVSSHRAQLLFLDGQSQNLGSFNKHQGKTSTDGRSHNHVTVQDQSNASDHHPTELAGESTYDLEEFPSLIEAEEIIDIFPLDSDSSETQLSPVESFQILRKTHHIRADLT